MDTHPSAAVKRREDNGSSTGDAPAPAEGSVDALLNDLPPLQDYERALPNPVPRIVFASVVVLFVLAVALRAKLLVPLGIEDGQTPTGRERFLFLAYLGLYAVWWGTYLSSNVLPDKFQVRALRTLLERTSIFWRGDARTIHQMSEGDRRDLIDALKAKASGSIGALGMLVSMSFLTLTLLPTLYLNFNRTAQATENSLPFEVWPFPLYAAVVVGFSAFVCLLISVDALDTVLNGFRLRGASEEDAVKALIKTHRNSSLDAILKSHFYRQAGTRRYLGFVLSIAQMVLVVAYLRPQVGCVMVSLALAIGYSYWFPSILRQDEVRRWGIWVAVLLMIPLLGPWVGDQLPTSGLIAAEAIGASVFWGLGGVFLHYAIVRLKPASTAEAHRGMALLLLTALLAVCSWLAVQHDFPQQLPGWRSAALWVAGGCLLFWAGPVFYLRAFGLNHREDETRPLWSASHTVIGVILGVLLALARGDERGLPTSVVLLPLAAATFLAFQEVRAATLTEDRAVATRRASTIAALRGGGELFFAMGLVHAGAEARSMSTAALEAAAIGMLLPTIVCSLVLVRHVVGKLSRLQGAAEAEKKATGRLPWGGFFIFYGLVGFGIAYPAFFDLVARRGLAGASLLCAAAPAVAQYLFAYHALLRDRPYALEKLSPERKRLAERLGRLRSAVAFLFMPGWAWMLVATSMLAIALEFGRPGS